MTAAPPSPDLDAIQARRKEHGPCTAEVCGSRVCQTARDRDALLALVRSQQAKIERVEALGKELFEISNDPGFDGAVTRAAYRDASRAIRAALTATEGAA